MLGDTLVETAPRQVQGHLRAFVPTSRKAQHTHHYYRAAALLILKSEILYVTGKAGSCAPAVFAGHLFARGYGHLRVQVVGCCFGCRSAINAAEAAKPLNAAQDRPCAALPARTCTKLTVNSYTNDM